MQIKLTKRQTHFEVYTSSPKLGGLDLLRKILIQGHFDMCTSYNTEVSWFNGLNGASTLQRKKKQTRVYVNT